MAELTSRERVMRALKREEPDRVPHFEWLIARKVREALAPGCKSHNEFAVRMGHDAILVDPDFTKTPIGPTRWRTEWGYAVEYGQEEHGVEVECPIQTLADLERYTPPDPRAPGRYASLEKAVRDFKGRMAIGVHLNDVFSIPRYLMGMQNLLMAIACDPALVAALVGMSVEVNLAMAGEVAARGADFVWTGDDYAGNAGPLMSPQHFRSLFHPGLKRVAQGFKELGLPFIKHCDGNIQPIIGLMVDAGISCLDPIDPQGGMDLADVKARFGDRVAVKGNVDCTRVLPFGTAEEVAAETRRALREGAPGGGYILSSSNSIHSAVRPENYRVMLDTLKRHGRYPISLEG
ncbi:MAG TPA: uroporphyrinogen decarboxylase family protein [Phycisphaerae bacterium]|nr:uroporphyrinogen decarboxylase family protein [Phycisphaerae bacterium]